MIFQNVVCGDLATVENPVLTKNGEERLIRWRNSVLRDEDGRVTKRSGIRVNLKVNQTFGRMPSDVELSLFKVVQESLTNVQRHSGSSQVTIRLERRLNDTRIEVTDTGRNVAGKGNRTNGEIPFEVGVGIPSMQERVKSIGGLFEIDSGDHGTTLRVTIPLRKG